MFLEYYIVWYVIKSPGYPLVKNMICVCIMCYALPKLPLQNFELHFIGCICVFVCCVFVIVCTMFFQVFDNFISNCRYILRNDF